jgi:hypothetical protein
MPVFIELTRGLPQGISKGLRIATQDLLSFIWNVRPWLLRYLRPARISIPIGLGVCWRLCLEPALLPEEHW